jgi:hypothetical protein
MYVFNTPVYDSITVSGLNQGILNGAFGLDSVTVNINAIWASDLVISLISPDGTTVHLSERNGGTVGNSYTGTNFNMNATYMVSEFTAPFTGSMRPDNSIGVFNNGQNGNGTWQLKVYAPGANVYARIVNFGLHFNNSPETSYFSSSKLPIVIVNTNYQIMDHLYWQPGFKQKIDATMGIIYNGPGQENHLGDSMNHYQGNIKIAVRGSTSVGFAQRSYAVDLKNANDEDTSVSLLDMPEEEDWILYAPGCDKSLIRNIIAYQLSNEAGRYAARTRLCELVLNGDYRGVYVLEENIKRSPDRVAVQKMEANDTTGEDLTGGYIIQINRGGIADTEAFVSNYMPCQGAATDIRFRFEYPRPENIQQPQKEYIAAYVDSFENALANIDPDDINNGYRRYIDVPSFIDFSIMQELSNNVDGYRISSYLYKPKNDKLFAGPVWDFNIAYGNAYYYNSYSAENFRWDLPCPFFDPYLNPFWWNKFLEDTNYVHEFKCRYSELRSGPLSVVHLSQMMDSLREMLEIPQQRHFEKWPVLGRYINPNIYIGQTWEDEMEYLETWLYERIAFLDETWYEPSCALSAATVNNNDDNTIVVYPNPVSEDMYIESAQKANEVIVYNEVGQMVFSKKEPALKYHIDVRNWARGIYIIETRTAKGQHKQKISIL